ncbi:MAG: proprotein convertase P-domain-containing protein [Anaerolineae bacterium]|nr:proprotein convertase P-domain-containing protein [Anaerolineae bacterium]
MKPRPILIAFLTIVLACVPLFSVAIFAAATTYTNDTPLAVPDGADATRCNVPGAPVTSTINVPASLPVADLNVALNISAGWVGDVWVSLTSPAGTTVTLVDGPGSGVGCGFGSSDLVTTLDDESSGGPVENGNPPTGPSYTPQQPLSAFDGQNAAGAWTLTVRDRSGGDAITLKSWSLIISGNFTPVAVNDLADLPVGGSVLIPVTANDTDADNAINPASVAIGTTPACGTAVPDGAGGVVYTNVNTACAGDAFTYTVRDVEGAVSNVATVLVGLAAPPPALIPTPPPAPRCNDMDFDEEGPVRAWLPDAYRQEVYCHMIAQDGNYLTWLGGPLTHAGQIGVASVLERGVLHAVDVFSPHGLGWYEGGAVVCLRGEGALWFLPAAGVPRSAQDMVEYTVEEFAGFTCTTLYMPGTLVLTGAQASLPSQPSQPSSAGGAPAPTADSK